MPWKSLILFPSATIHGSGVQETIVSPEVQNSIFSEFGMIAASLEGMILQYDDSGIFKRFWRLDENIRRGIPDNYPGLSMADASIHHPAFTAPFIEDYQNAFQQKQSCSREFPTSIGPDARWFFSRISPFFLPDGLAQGFTQQITDTTGAHNAKLATEQQNTVLRHIEKEYAEIVEHATEVIIKLDASGMEMVEKEKALTISEEHYRSLFDALGEGIIMISSDGSILTCNKSSEKIFNTTREEIMGFDSRFHSAEYFHEDGSPFPPEQHPAYLTLQTGKSYQNVVMGLTQADSDITWISINTEPVYYSASRLKPDAVVGSFIDITRAKESKAELLRREKLLIEYSVRISNILDSITDGFIAVDNNLNVILWNHIFEKAISIRSADAVGRNIMEVLGGMIDPAYYNIYLEALKNKNSLTLEHFYGPSGIWFETSMYPSAEGQFIYFRDITHRKKQQKLLSLEKEVLEINARPAASLKLVLDYFLSGLEDIFPGIYCSILALDADRKLLRQLSAPSLPADLFSALDGSEIGTESGSCGAAMFLKKTVITTDIYSDPKWKNYLSIAQRINVSSCWSFPIITSSNEVIATIAVYHQEKAAPSESDLNTFERVGNLLKIIIENKNAEATVLLSNERYLLATKATNDALWDWDVFNNQLYWGDGFYNIFGYNPGKVSATLNFWESCIHPDDKERVLHKLQAFINKESSGIWQDEYRFRNEAGKFLLVLDRGFLIFNKEGKVNRMVGSLQDVTEKKELEQKLLKQEMHKQKLIAQAVVDAQEKERAGISNELHDNVNQILTTAKLCLELAANNEKERISLINRSINNISTAVGEIRKISHSLVPASIGDLGLIVSIEDLVEDIKLTKTLHVEFYHHGTIERLITPKRKLMLFRIIQEQTTNVLKHAEAKNLVIELDVDGHAIHLSISDDGKGFDKNKIKAKKGVGLYNIESRAKLFNGKISMITAPGKGCKLAIEIPV